MVTTCMEPGWKLPCVPYRENKLMVTSGEREEGRGMIGGGHYEVQTNRYKISYMNILYNTGNIANVL